MEGPVVEGPRNIVVINLLHYAINIKGCYKCLMNIMNEIQ